MDKIDAVFVFANELNIRKQSKTSFKRIGRACDVLALDQAEKLHVLRKFGYLDKDGVPYPWASCK